MTVLLAVALAACSQQPNLAQSQARAGFAVTLVGSKSPARVARGVPVCARQPDLLKQIPCYCGCGAMGHKSNYACYVKEIKPDGSVNFDDPRTWVQFVRGHHARCQAACWMRANRRKTSARRSWQTIASLGRRINDESQISNFKYQFQVAALAVLAAIAVLVVPVPLTLAAPQERHLRIEAGQFPIHSLCHQREPGRPSDD